MMGSIPLAAVGILALALIIVPGQSAWYLIRSGMFGVFGIISYLLGPMLLYLAYLMASGYRISKFVVKSALLALVCASVPVVFSDFKVGDSDFIQVIQSLFAWRQERFWSGGVLGGLIGASLVALCGRPAANFVMILLFVTGLMVFFAVTPGTWCSLSLTSCPVCGRRGPTRTPARPSMTPLCSPTRRRRNPSRT